MLSNEKKIELVPILPVRIYPGRVMIDGSTVYREELKETLLEIYQGVRFQVNFTCSFCEAEEVREIRKILGV